MRHELRMKLAVTTSAIVAVGGVQAVTIAVADAAFPGGNGAIYFADGAGGDSEIYSLKSDGTGLAQLTDNSSEDVSAVASADGARLAFLSDRTGEPQVWTMNQDGTDQTQVTTQGASAFGFYDIVLSWSPNGKIVYADSAGMITSINPDGSDRSPLGAFGLDPVVSPDGSKIAYIVFRESNADLFVMDADGANPTQLTTYEIFSGPFHPEWSPDGSKIAFTSLTGYFNIHTINADGTNQTTVTSGPAQLVPQWSPDGTRILYTELADFTLRTINPDGTADTLLYNLPSAGVATDWAVGYQFTGFFAPVENAPTLNTMKAGRAVPVKFSLNGDQGMDIFWAGSPSSQEVDCQSGLPTSAVDETMTAGGSSLAYDPIADQYVYVWKTEEAWAGTCRVLRLRLADGTDHTADFQLR